MQPKGYSNCYHFLGADPTEPLLMLHSKYLESISHLRLYFSRRILKITNKYLRKCNQYKLLEHKMRRLDFEMNCMREIIVCVFEGKQSSHKALIEFQKILKLLGEENGSYTALHSEPAIQSIMIEKSANLHVVDFFNIGAVDMVRRKQCKTSSEASSQYADLEQWPSTSIFKLYKNMIWIICYDKKMDETATQYLFSLKYYNYLILIFNIWISRKVIDLLFCRNNTAMICLCKTSSSSRTRKGPTHSLLGFANKNGFVWDCGERESAEATKALSEIDKFM